MSVYKPKNSPHYQYDFWIEGRRFSGSTRATTRRLAEQIEEERRDAARAEVRKGAEAQAGPFTILDACDRYWAEVGQFQKRNDNIQRALAWLSAELGPKTPLRQIGNDEVSRLVAKRRGQAVVNRAAEKTTAIKRRLRPRKPPRPVSAATDNRSVTELLRKVFNRAREAWEKDVRPIKWTEHMLAEPRERIREASADEEARLFAALPAHLHAPVRFALLSGFRISEVTGLEWSRIDWGARLIGVLGKGDKEAHVPLTPRLRELLFPLQGRHKTHVFVYDNGEKMKADGLRNAFTRAVRRAGVENFRFHDLRHTAGTRMLRKTGNLKLAGKLLRHSDLSSTMRYAHADDEDLRAAMEAVDADAPTQNPIENPELAPKPLKQQ